MGQERYNGMAGPIKLQTLNAESKYRTTRYRTTYFKLLMLVWCHFSSSNIVDYVLFLFKERVDMKGNNCGTAQVPGSADFN